MTRRQRRMEIVFLASKMAFHINSDTFVATDKLHTR